MFTRLYPGDILFLKKFKKNQFWHSSSMTPWKSDILTPILTKLYICLVESMNIYLKIKLYYQLWSHYIIICYVVLNSNMKASLKHSTCLPVLCKERRQHVVWTKTAEIPYTIKHSADWLLFRVDGTSSDGGRTQYRQ